MIETKEQLLASFSDKAQAFLDSPGLVSGIDFDDAAVTLKRYVLSELHDQELGSKRTVSKADPPAGCVDPGRTDHRDRSQLAPPATLNDGRSDAADAGNQRAKCFVGMCHPFSIHACNSGS